MFQLPRSRVEAPVLLQQLIRRCGGLGLGLLGLGCGDGRWGAGLWSSHDLAAGDRGEMAAVVEKCRELGSDGTWDVVFLGFRKGVFCDCHLG